MKKICCFSDTFFTRILMKFGSIFGVFFINICVEIEKRDFVKPVLASEGEARNFLRYLNASPPQKAS